MRYLLALFFALCCVRNVNAEVAPIQGGSTSGNITESAGGSFGNSAAVSFAHDDVITSSHPCRVIQSTTTKGLASASGTNTAWGASIAGSTITLLGVSASNYGRVCGRWNSYLSAAGAFGCTPVLNSVPATSLANGVWSTYSNAALMVNSSGECWQTPTTLPAGTNTISLACLGDGGTWTFYGAGSNQYTWLTFEEVTCKW